MIDKKTHDERLERLMNPLAESVLGISDEAVLTETSEAGADPEQEAEHTRLVLRQASKALDNVTAACPIFATRSIRTIGIVGTRVITTPA